eukprot:354903-Chlamydomonas_euryale.AAC.31
MYRALAASLPPCNSDDASTTQTQGGSTSRCVQQGASYRRWFGCRCRRRQLRPCMLVRVRQRCSYSEKVRKAGGAMGQKGASRGATCTLARVGESVCCHHSSFDNGQRSRETPAGVRAGRCKGVGGRRGSIAPSSWQNSAPARTCEQARRWVTCQQSERPVPDPPPLHGERPVPDPPPFHCAAHFVADLLARADFVPTPFRACSHCAPGGACQTCHLGT